MQEKEIDNLIEEFNRISKGAGVSDYLNWSRKAVKMLKKIREEIACKEKKQKDLHDYTD